MARWTKTRTSQGRGEKREGHTRQDIYSVRRAVMPGPAEKKKLDRYYYDYLRPCIEKERKEKRRCRDGNESTNRELEER